MKTAIRGAMLTFKADPFFHDLKDSMTYESDALIVMEDGKITRVGKAADILTTLPNNVNITNYTWFY